MDKYRFFTNEELKCKCEKCKDDDEVHMDPQFMEDLIYLRETMGFGFPVTSAYRCEDHPVEARKSTPGAHNSGKAIDIAVSRVRAYKLLREALAMGFVGVGVSQKGDDRFIHLDQWVEGSRPALWSY